MYFTIDRFWDILSAISSNAETAAEGDALTDALDSLALDAQAKASKYFDVAMGGYPPSSEPDWIRLRSFLLDWYSAHQTISSSTSQITDPRTLANSDLDELFRSFGYPYSTQLRGPDDNPTDLKVNFFLDLVNLYKIKGTPQSIVEVLQYYGVTNLNLYEFFIERSSTSSLIFEGKAVAGTETNPSDLIFEYDRLTSGDPHWLYTEQQILSLYNQNDINLPSKTPYLGVQPIASIDGAEIGILVRIVQDQYEYYLTNGILPTANAEISETGEVVTLLELYLSIIYVFQKQFSVGQVGDSFICYDGTNNVLTEVTEIIGEFETITAKPTTRAEILTGLEAFYDTFSRETPRNFLQNVSDAETILTTINPTLKSDLDNSTLTDSELLFSLVKDLSNWVRINLGYGFVNMGFIMFGLDSFFEDLKPVINFFKPYRARLLLLELLQINNPLFNTIIVEDFVDPVDVEFPIYDFVTGDGNPCCTLVDIDTTDCCTVCLEDSTASLFYARETYDCGSYHDIGAVTDILQNDFFPEIHEIRHVSLICVPNDATADIVLNEVMEGQLIADGTSTIIVDSTAENAVFTYDSTDSPYYSLAYQILYEEMSTGGFAVFDDEGGFDCPTGCDNVRIIVTEEGTSTSSSSSSVSSSSSSVSSSSSSVSSSSSSSSFSVSSSSSSQSLGILNCTFSPDDDFTGANGSAPDTDRWTRTLTSDGICEIQSNQLRMWSNANPGGTARLDHNAKFDDDFVLQIEWFHISSGGSVPINWWIQIIDQTSGNRVRFNRGNNPSDSYNNYIFIEQYNGSYSTTYSITNPINSGYFEGTLRFVRNGSSLETWVEDDQPTSLTLRDTMAGFGTGLVTYRIYLPNSSNSNLNTWRFDNFFVNGGLVSCVSSSSSSTSSSSSSTSP